MGSVLSRNLHVLLLATLVGLAPLAHAEESPDLVDQAPPSSKDRGWKGLAKVLKALEPSVDTSVPPSASEITDRIEGLINDKRYNEALDAIASRKANLETQQEPGEDVQLLFLEARALAGSGQHDKAISAYHDMTVQYPELPEPWNNLASEYVRQNRLDEAQQALDAALASDPDYTEARLNLGLVQLMLAHQTLTQAASLGSKQAQRLANQAEQLLDP